MKKNKADIKLFIERGDRESLGTTYSSNVWREKLHKLSNRLMIGSIVLAILIIMANHFIIRLLEIYA